MPPIREAKSGNSRWLTTQNKYLKTSELIYLVSAPLLNRPKFTN